MISSFYTTLAHVRYLARSFGKKDAYCVVSMVLMELGLASRHDGYDYLLKAVLLYFQDPSQQIMKQLYPAVAQMYGRGISAKQVERSIRSAIKEAWKKHNPDVWIRYFSPGIDGKIEKPSNTEFISRVARVLELWKGCCEKFENEACKEDMV